VARTHVLFELSPHARLIMAIIGAVTLLYAGVSALAQNDIKRALAYSTISQVGYMFLALGVAAWSAAIFHFMTHAFFKALLFLAAGLVIKAMNEEHDIRKMGGLRRDIPVVYRLFLIGAASLSALPLVTAGFYSKDLIVDSTISSQYGSIWLWLAGVVGALLTSLYAFRLVFLVFFGERRAAPVVTRFARIATAPMLVLAVAAVVSGWIQLPPRWGGWSLFTDFLQPALPLPLSRAGASAGSALGPVIAAVAGVYLAYLFFGRRQPAWRSLAVRPGFQRLTAFALAGWGFDRFYDVSLVRPFLWLARHGRGDALDKALSSVAWLTTVFNGWLRKSQSGRLRYYLASAAFGVVVFVAVGLLR
jgi:NADH-quinone oxidoreductase subunit L